MIIMIPTTCEGECHALPLSVPKNWHHLSRQKTGLLGFPRITEADHAEAPGAGLEATELDAFYIPWEHDIGVSVNGGTPKWMVKIMENPIKMDDLGENPPFKETPIWENVVCFWKPLQLPTFHWGKCCKTGQFGGVGKILVPCTNLAVASKDLAYLGLSWEMVKCSKICCWLQPFKCFWTASQYFWHLYVAKPTSFPLWNRILLLQAVPVQGSWRHSCSWEIEPLLRPDAGGPSESFSTKSTVVESILQQKLQLQSRSLAWQLTKQNLEQLQWGN